MNWDVLILEYFLRRLSSSDSLKTSGLIFDDRLDLSSPLNNILPERKFENQFLNYLVSNDILAINTEPFLSYFYSVFVIPKLQQHKMSDIHF